jgi:hypothetical protein
VLQACHEEQWARHVVVAIGALHQSLEVSSHTRSNKSRGTADGEREGKSHYIFALQQYGKALGQLSNISGQEDQSESHLRYALISSLLTTAAETYIGNLDNAFTQAKAGVDLLLKWTAKHAKSPVDDLADEWSDISRVTSRSLYLDVDLLEAFQRLDYQLLVCKGIQPDRKVPPTFPSADCPFTSVKEACIFWDRVIRRIFHFHAITDPISQHCPQFFYDNNNGISDTTGKVYQKHVQTERQNFSTAAEQFFRYFRPIFESSRQRPGTNEYLLANLVMVRSLCCRVAISRGPSNSEMYPDRFLRDYMLVIELARELIDNSKTTLRKAIFNFDIALGYSIFTVANRCRDPKVRRAAVDLLLEFPYREGWFDTLVAANISMWIMTMEEEGMVNGFIPDTARLRLISHEVGPQRRMAVIRCSKFVWKDGKAARELLPLVTITW